MTTTEQSREQWLAERKLGVGGSDVSSLFSIGYGCRRRLYYDKTGTAPDFPFIENDAMSLGKHLEGWFADKYERETGRKVVTYDEPFVHPSLPASRVNLDRGILSERGWGALEIKAMGRGMFYKVKRKIEDDGGLPEDYVLQLQQGMLVPHMHGKPMFSYGAFCIGCRDDGQLMHWDVERNDTLCASIMDATVEFWLEVQSCSIPDRLEPDDRRCQSCSWRTTCQGNALVQLEGDGEVKPMPELRGVLAVYDERKGLFEQAEELLEESKEMLRVGLAGNQAAVVGERKVYNRTQAGKTTYEGKELLKVYGQMWREEADAMSAEGLNPEQIDKAMSDHGLPMPESLVKKGKPFAALRVY